SLLFSLLHATATTRIYTLSLHDALPILSTMMRMTLGPVAVPRAASGECTTAGWSPRTSHAAPLAPAPTTSTQSATAGDVARPSRSEEHTSELQSRCHLVCRLLLGKKSIS